MSASPSDAAAAEVGGAPGEIRPDGDRCAVRFERLYPVTPDELWAALTDPTQLSHWLADASRFELTVGGAVHLEMGHDQNIRGTIVALEPPRLLEYTWTATGEDESVVRFEIVPRDAGCLLVLDHRRLMRDAGAEYGAGWHAHLDALGAKLVGGAADFLPRYLELRPTYDGQAADLGPDWAGPGGTPLLDALVRGDAALAREIAAAQPDLRELPDAQGLLPATRALYMRGRELAEALAPPDDDLDVFVAAALGRTERLAAIAAGDAHAVRAWSPDGFTPLHLACFSGGAATTRVLVELGAPLETVSQHVQVRVRPLGTAAFSRDVESAEVLLDAGADPDGVGERGFTPLHTAAQHGDTQLVRLLLGRGAAPHARAADGRTPADIARAAGHEAVAELLESATT